MTKQRCTYCGSDKHTVENCPKTWNGQGNRNAMRCTYCGSNTHKVTSCRWLGRDGRVPTDFVRDR